MKPNEHQEETLYRFPVNVFPPVLRQLIIEANKACNFPMSYMGASILFALSTAIGNTCTLRIKRSRVERCILYLHLIGEPGSAKSHPLRFALKPIIKRDIKNRRSIRSSTRNISMSCKVVATRRSRFVVSV